MPEKPEKKTGKNKQTNKQNKNKNKKQKNKTKKKTKKKKQTNKHPEKHKKRVVFFEIEHENRDQGSKHACFQEKGSFLFLNAIRGHFFKILYPTKHVPQQILFKIGCKTLKILVYGCFSSKEQLSIRVCFENIWSRMCTTQPR